MAARIPKFVKFAYSDLKIDNAKNKWPAKYNHCGETLTEKRSTTSGFVKHLTRRHSTVYEDYEKI